MPPFALLGLSLPDLTLLALAAALLGLSKTAVPGAATITVAVFAAVLPARASTGVLLVLLILGDLFAVWTYRAHADWPVLRRLVPAVLAGVALGTLFLAVAGDTTVRRVIGVILLLLVAVTFVRRARARPAARERPGGAGRFETSSYGALAGFTTMVANAGGPVMSLYLLAAGFSMSRFLGTTAWFFFAVNVAKAPFSVSLGLISLESLQLDLLLAPAIVIGALAGRPLARRIDQRLFDRLVLALTVLSAAYLLMA